jgi:hypothetical protein
VNLTDLIPTFPSGFDAWESLVTAFLIAVLKMYRARVMKHRSVFVDRFGWSIIGYDIIFGIAVLIGVFFTIYPGITPHVWIGRMATTWVLFAVIWQLAELYLASDARVNAAVAGAPIDSPPPTGSERRMYDRRQETRELKAELRRYQEEAG